MCNFCNISSKKWNDKKKWMVFAHAKLDAMCQQAWLHKEPHPISSWAHHGPKPKNNLSLPQQRNVKTMSWGLITMEYKWNNWVCVIELLET